MDFIIIVLFSLSGAIVSALIARFNKKSKGKILLFAVIGAIIGWPIGYWLAPVILAYY